MENEDSQAKREAIPVARVSKDQLEYMADLLLELTEMARSNNLATLAGIIELASMEARMRAKELG